MFWPDSLTFRHLSTWCSSPTHWLLLLSRQVSSSLFTAFVYLFIFLERASLGKWWRKPLSYSSIILFNFLSKFFRRLTPGACRLHERRSRMCIGSTSVPRAVPGAGYTSIMWRRWWTRWSEFSVLGKHLKKLRSSQMRRRKTFWNRIKQQLSFPNTINEWGVLVVRFQIQSGESAGPVLFKWWSFVPVTLFLWREWRELCFVLGLHILSGCLG